MRATILAVVSISALSEAFLSHTTFSSCPSTQWRESTAESACYRRFGGPLFGLAEWRDLDFDLPGTEQPLGVNSGGVPKSVCLLPFPFEEVLLQGETKQLRLYEDRFVKLFRDVMDNHEGVVAMGLLASSGIIQTVPLCEVEAYNRMDGFGIFVTIRVVGRASLLDIMKQEPYLKAVCTEVIDELPPNLELPCLIANNIENHMLLLSSMEHRLKEAGRKKEIGEDIDDEEMQRRIAIAKLEDRFYAADEEDEVDEDDDDDDDDDEANETLDRAGRFRQAYKEALATDTQGYAIKGDTGDRSPQDLTALSWAAFNTDLVLTAEDAAHRIQALDSKSLFDRLKLAAQVLRQKKDQLRTQMVNAGIEMSRKDDEEGGSDRKKD